MRSPSELGQALIRLNGEGGEAMFEERAVVLDSRAIDTLLTIPI
jgi:hypothetical protein